MKRISFGRRHIALTPASTAYFLNDLDCYHLYAERVSPGYEKAAMRWLERYLAEGTPRLQHFAEIAASLAEREPGQRSTLIWSPVQPEGDGTTHDVHRLFAQTAHTVAMYGPP